MNIDYAALEAAAKQKQQDEASKLDARIEQLKRLSDMLASVDHHIQRLHTVSHYLADVQLVFNALGIEGRQAIPADLLKAMEALNHITWNLEGALVGHGPAASGLVNIAKALETN